jgi:hypothetical protein
LLEASEALLEGNQAVLFRKTIDEARELAGLLEIEIPAGRSLDNLSFSLERIPCSLQCGQIHADNSALGGGMQAVEADPKGRCVAGQGELYDFAHQRLSARVQELVSGFGYPDARAGRAAPVAWQETP